jgi:hypothetical protein
MSAAKPVRAQITNQHDAEALLSRIGDSMVALVKIFEEETSLMKAGRLVEASALTEEKTALASQYLREIELLKANAPYIGRVAPSLVDELRKAHAAFRDILSLNLRVVATAQSVAESVMRGAANEAARRVAPKGYSADGRTTAKVPSRPVVLSRSS